MASWQSLPTEIHLAIVRLLDVHPLSALSQTDKHTHALCTPYIFQSVTAPSFGALQAFFNHVPPAYGTHIRALDISTKYPTNPADSTLEPGTPRTDALVRLLRTTPRLERLVLRLSGGLAPHIVAAFPALTRLTHLEILNAEDEDVAPLSERTIVAIALALPNLSSLSLTRITRSLSSAQDISPCIPVPLVKNDTADFPADEPPVLSLPTLFTIPTLRHLAIRDTHLGDRRFNPTLLSATAPLESLEIGAYDGVAPAENASWTGRLMECAGPALTHAVLSAALPVTPTLSFPALKSIRMTPLMPPAGIPDTLAALAEAGAPLARVEVECLVDDVEDVCEEIADAGCTGSWELYLRIVRELEGDVLATSRACKGPIVLDADVRDTLRRLEREGMCITLEGAIVEEDEDDDSGSDWDERTVVDDAAVPEKAALRASFAEMEGVRAQEEPW
ncbi:hypothetical protein BV25DRAFT_1822433 [Artomyces pyxidatus]|uniref:Uncharacterized protein n=1 Tax=Artomyces pyxidatus TaxID=48021 RepID=A0ACB8TB88_9AGAM|nr:hypothetical protein BV25DRAFT_1822433 [Artomyces pyxidatus]